MTSNPNPTQWTQGEIEAARDLWGIPPHFVPLASAGGVVAWGVPSEPLDQVAPRVRDLKPREEW